MYIIDIDNNADDFDTILFVWKNSKEIIYQSFDEWLDFKKIKYSNHGEDDLSLSYVQRIYFENEKEFLAFKLKNC
jgi:hypothetical protein